MAGSAIEGRITLASAGAQPKARAQRRMNSTNGTDGNIGRIGGGDRCSQQLSLRTDVCLTNPIIEDVKAHDRKSPIAHPKEQFPRSLMTPFGPLHSLYH